MVVRLQLRLLLLLRLLHRLTLLEVGAQQVDPLAVDSWRNDPPLCPEQEMGRVVVCDPGKYACKTGSFVCTDCARDTYSDTEGA